MVYWSGRGGSVLVGLLSVVGRFPEICHQLNPFIVFVALLFRSPDRSFGSTGLGEFSHILPAFWAFLMFYPCFFIVLEHLHFYLAFFMFWHPYLILFLVFIFVCFYLVKCTFLQNTVNYDAWHTFWSLHGALPLHGHPSPPFLGSAQDGGDPLLVY